jgi:hypothetical protein
LAYDSYYQRDETEEIKDSKTEKKPDVATVSIAGPLIFWIGLLVIGAVLQLVAIPLAKTYNHTAFDAYFNTFANYVIYIPGLLILPLVASLWIGDRVSYVDRKKSLIAYKGIINALYAAMVYAVAIFIIYFIMQFKDIGVLAMLNMTTFAEYLIAIPIIITLVMVPLFAVLSAARRYG